MLDIYGLHRTITFNVSSKIAKTATVWTHRYMGGGMVCAHSLSNKLLYPFKKHIGIYGFGEKTIGWDSTAHFLGILFM